MRKLHSIQLLRGIAACAVVGLHAYGLDKSEAGAGYAKLGAAGVDLFFVISGFIMANVSQGRTAERFLRARVKRIYPLWLVAMLPWLFIVPPDIPRLVASLTLWPIYGRAFVYPSLSLGWTLSFEMLFYLAMALALLTRPLVPLALFAACFALSLATRSALFAYLGSPLIFEFLAGVVIAKLPRDNPRLGFLALAGIALFAVSPLWLYSRGAALVPELALYRVGYWGGAAALIVYGALCLEKQLSKIPTLLGDASYSIYLFHLLAVIAIPGPWPLKFAGGVGLGVFIWWALERHQLRRASLSGAALKVA